MTIPAGYQYNECRGMLRHAWHEVDSHHWFEASRNTSLTPFTIRCERCDTERRDLLDRSAELYSRRYVYPVGYRIDQEEGSPKLLEFRQHWLMQAVREIRKETQARRTKRGTK